jgi:hypothetical protein
VGLFLPQPIPLGLDGGALVSTATVNGGSPFSVLIDTGSPVTVWDDHKGVTSLQTGTFILHDKNGVPRLELDQLGFYATPLRSLGLSGFPVGGVLGGDNLQRWVVGLDYRGTPQMSIFDQLTPCDCELADQGQVAMRFLLAGGGADRDVSIGGEVVAYPPSRILVEACLEPLWDPLSRELPCATNVPLEDPDNQRPPTHVYYRPTGVDSRLIISTGFPGVALSSSIFDRLRGVGASAAALSHPTLLHFPDEADDGGGATGLAVGTATLGRQDVAALVMVALQGSANLGACAEVARSRRQRRSPVDHPRVSEDMSVGPGLASGPTNESGCFLRDACTGGGDPENCDDSNDKRKVFVSPMLEFDDQIPIYILPDTAPLLVGINADVRPASSTVDGILGTEILQRVVGYIDYPQHRISMRCVAGTGCLGYPTFVDSTRWDTNCGRDEECVEPRFIPFNGGLATPLSP